MKTLHTIYNNFAKTNLASLRFLLVMLLTLTVSAAWAADVTLSSSTITSGKELAYTSEWTYTANNVSWSGYCYTDANSRPWIQLKKDKGVYVKIVTPSGSKITQLKVTITSSSNSSGGITDITKHTDFSGRVALLTEDATGSTSMTGVAYTTTVSNDIATLNPSGNNNTLYLKVSAAARIWSMTVTYETAAAATYKVTYNANGATSGTAPTDATSYTSGATVTVKSNSGNLAKTGYTFGGWNTKSDGTGTNYTAGSGTFTITANTTLYAKWNTATKYTVTLKDDNSTLTQSSAGGSVTLPSRDGCEGYTFAGWTKSWSVAQSTWTTTAPNIIPTGSYTPTANESLYPVYTKTEGGSSTPTNVTKVYSGANDADLKFSTGSSSNNLVNNDGYTAGNVNVKFTTGTNSNNSYYDGSVVRFYAGSSLIVTPLNDVTITQVEFVRSTSSSSNAGTISTDQLTASQSNSTTNTNVFTGSATSAVTFKNSGQCRFSVLRITYTTSGGSSTTSYISVPDCTTPTTITLDRQGGAGGTESVTVTDGEAMPAITIPTRAGYNFQGYYTEEGGAGTQYYNAAGKGVKNWDKADAIFTLYAKWTEKSLTNYRTFCEVVCDAYSFHTGIGEKETWAKEAIKCFTQLGSTTEWQIKDYIIPNDDEKFFVGKYGYFYNDNLGTNNSRSLEKTWAEEMYIAPAMDMNDGPGSPKLGKAVGAKGTLRIFDDSDWNNLYVGFIPDGYKLKFGTTEHTFTLHNEGNHEWRSEEVVEYNSTTAAHNVSVGVVDAAGKYVATNHTQEMRHIFLKVNSDWATDNAKFAVYEIDAGDFKNGFMKLVPGSTDLYEGWVDKLCTKIIFVRHNNTADSPTWENKWNQTGDLTLSNDKNLFTITDWGTGTWSTYEKYGQFAMHDNSKSKNWYVHFVPHYVLTYDKNADDATGEMDVQTVAVDADDKKVIVANCGFTCPGYRFIRWKYDATLNYNAGVNITLDKDITLKAVWEEEIYNITYKDQGNVDFSGTHELNYPTQHTYGAATALKSATKTGSTFNGWYDNPECTGSSIVELGATDFTSDITLYAKWTINTHTVTWNPAGGNWSGDANNIVKTCEYGAPVEAPEKPVRNGYEFVEWTPAYTTGMTMPDEDLVFTAQWRALSTYTITWMVNGEQLTPTGGDPFTTEVTEGHSFSGYPKKPDMGDSAPDGCSGKVFVGWTPDGPIAEETDTPPLQSLCQRPRNHPYR